MPWQGAAATVATAHLSSGRPADRTMYQLPRVRYGTRPRPDGRAAWDSRRLLELQRGPAGDEVQPLALCCTVVGKWFTAVVSGANFFEARPAQNPAS